MFRPTLHTGSEGWHCRSMLQEKSAVANLSPDASFQSPAEQCDNTLPVWYSCLRFSFLDLCTMGPFRHGQTSCLRLRHPWIGRLWTSAHDMRYFKVSSETSLDFYRSTCTTMSLVDVEHRSCFLFFPTSSRFRLCVAKPNLPY